MLCQGMVTTSHMPALDEKVLALARTTLQTVETHCVSVSAGSPPLGPPVQTAIRKP